MTEDTQNPITPQEFAKKVKAKYPQYANVDDITLAKKMVEKYPEYASQVNFNSKVKKKDTLESPKLQVPQEDTTELPVEDGSSDTPVINDQRRRLTSKDLIGLSDDEQPTDMSGKPLLPKKGDSIQTLNRIYKENQALEAEKKKYGDVFDKQLNIKPKVEESQYLKDRLSTINTELINQTEESVVPELQYQFGDLGFNFEKTGVLGDYVKVTSPDGKKTTEISLDNFLSSKSKTQSEDLQKFIKENTPQKGLFVLEKTMREQDKKFNSDKQVDDSIKVISNDVNALNAKQKQFLIKKSQFEKDLNNLGPTAELEQQRLALNEEMKSILQEEETIKQKSKILDTAVGKYSISKSKQGTWGGAIWNAINEGASSILAGTESLLTDIATEMQPTGFGMSQKDLRDVSINISKKIGIKAPSAEQTIEQWKATLSEDQLNNWEDEVDDYIKKDVKSRALPLIRIGNREIFGDADTTKQFSDLKEKGFWGGAILGVSKSLPAMIGGASVAGWAQRTAQMYTQISDGLAVEMENDPSFANITENEKLAITLPIGIVSAALEELGLRNLKASKGVINSLVLKVLGKSGTGVTAKTFRELVENEVESSLARGLLTITAAGVAEFETGAAQEVTETGFKMIYDKIKGEDMFNTPDSKLDFVENILVAGAQEAIGGFILGVPSGVSAAYSKKGFLKMDDASFETFANMANDEKMQSAYIASLKDKITQGIMTEKEAKEELNNYRNSAGLFRSLPEGLSTQQKKEAMNLLKEKRDLENYVDGKDDALVVKQKSRIAEINDSLTKLSETDAIQEQTTDESVLRTEQPEMELQGVGERNAQGETITNAKPEETVGLPEEVSSLKDDEYVLMSVKTLEEIPEQFRERAELSALTEIETRKKIFGLPIGKKGSVLVGGGYTYILTGKEIKDYASQEKNTTTSKPQEVGLPDEVSQPIESSVAEQAITPVKEQWEIDYERRKQKVDEFNAENRPSAIEDETDDRFDFKISDRQNSEERSKLQQKVFDAQQNISRVDDVEAGIKEYNKKKKELQDFDDETQNMQNVRDVNDLIYNEIEYKEKDGDTYEFPEEFNKDPRDAALKRTKELIDFLEERKADNDLEAIDRYKNNVEILEKDIKENPLKKNTVVDTSKTEATKTKTIGDNPITSIDVVDEYNDMTKQYRDKKKAITLLARDNEITTKEANSLTLELRKNLKEATSSPKVQPTEAKAEVAPVETISEVASAKTIDLEQITKNLYVDKISRNIIEKVGNNWVVKTEVEGKELLKSKTLKGAKDFVSNDNQEALRVQPTEAKAEVAPKVEISNIDDLLDLDTTDKGSLQKVLDFLDSADDSLSKELGNLNAFSRVMAIGTAKVVVKALKVLVNAGKTLQEAIKQVAADQNLKVNDIVEGIKALTEISKIATQYNELMVKADKLIALQKKRGVSDKEIISKLDKMIRNSDVYKDENTNDAQRKIMEREARAKMDVSQRKAPSIGRVLGVLNDIKNVSREEKLKIISRIRELSKDAVKDLVEEIRELAKGGKITPTQSINIISRFGKVNMLNEISVSNFVDYMAKVFNDADYDNKINVAKGKLKNAKKNIDTKIGIANGLAFPLKTLFSINPSLIPIKNLDRYMELVDMFSARKAILQLDEISQVTKDVNEILEEIDNEQSIAQELAFRFNYSDNKVFEDGELNYAATIKKMVKQGEITQDEADLMTKYKKEIVPQVEKSKKSDEKLKEEKDNLIKDIKKSTINSSDLPTRNERAVAKRIAEYLKTPFINELSNSELSNLIKAIDNINNGYLPHQAQLILEKLDGLSAKKIITNSIIKSNLKKIGQFVNTVYNKIKSKFTGEDVIFEMIKRTPLFNIDQILGDFKTEDLFYGLLGKSAKGEAKFSFELKTIQDKLQKAQDKVIKSFSSNPFLGKISNYKIRTYQLQLENDSNPGDNRVNPAVEYIKATIQHINKLKSQYNENDVEILEGILKKFAPDGQIDINKLYNSFNTAEKAAIKVMQEIKKSEAEMAEFTGAVIRGKRIIPLNNHTHLSVLSDTSKEDLDVGISFANEYDNSLQPSTKAKNLMERTPGAKAINFDPYTTSLKSAKYVLLDYHLTAPIRTARKAMKLTEAELEKDGEMSKEQRRIFNSVNDAFDLATKDLVNNSYLQTSTFQDIINFVSKQGYRAVLAGLGKSVVELASNFGFVVTDPFTFFKGVQYMGILLSEALPAMMNNLNSIQTNRVCASGLSGRMIDVGILDQSVGTKSSKTRGKIINKAQQIWNLTVKKFVKNPVELTADTLISSPDKIIMRPYWLGSFISELEKQLGRKVTLEELKKIENNDEGYMNENEAALEAATKVADRKSKLMGATKNGFAGFLRGKTREGDKPWIAIIKNFNSFMTNFMVYEFSAAKTGVAAAIGQGTMTKREGAAVLAGVIIRMTVYNLLIKSVTSAASGLLGLALGIDDDEEEEEKTVDQLLTQSLASTFATLMFGRDFGNVSKTFINYGFEEYVTKEYLDGLRTGEYDPYKDAILFNSLQTDERTGELKLLENGPNFMGSYGPATKAVLLTIKAYSEEDKKTYKARERQEKERTIRVPLEIMGNLGYIPLYKEIRKAVMDDIYKDLKTKKSNAMSQEELKIKFPEMYERMKQQDSKYKKRIEEEQKKRMIK